MRGEGFEPSRLTAYAPQTYVYTIPPPALCFAKFLSRLVPRLSLGMVSKVEPLRRSMLCKATIYDTFQKSSCEAKGACLTADRKALWRSRTSLYLNLLKILKKFKRWGYGGHPLHYGYFRTIHRGHWEILHARDDALKRRQ